MGKTGYQKCKELIETLKLNEIENEFDVRTLKQFIRQNICTDERAVKHYINLLCEMGFLKTNNYLTFTFNKKEVQ